MAARGPGWKTAWLSESQVATDGQEQARFGDWWTEGRFLKSGTEGVRAGVV